MRVLMENGKEIRIFDGKFWGVQISSYGMEHKRLDYKTMLQALTYNEFFSNNTVINAVDDWELFNSEDYDEETDEYADIMAYFVMSERAATNLQKYTDEIIYYSPSLDLYLLGVCHCGTSWDYVLTSYEIMGE